MLQSGPRFGGSVCIDVAWNNAIEGPELDKEQKRWSDSYVRWSPSGTYLATFHHQGILLWGGPSWKKAKKFDEFLLKT